MESRCKTCGVPLDEIPFAECEEHAEHELRSPAPELSMDETMDIALAEAMASQFD